MDVTEQHAASESPQGAFDEIKRSEDRLRLVIDTIPTLVWRTGPRRFAPDFSFFHKIQRAEALVVKQVGCAQLSDTFRSKHRDDVPRFAERFGSPTTPDRRIR
jgi:hypothetical protein